MHSRTSARVYGFDLVSDRALPGFPAAAGDDTPCPIAFLDLVALRDGVVVRRADDPDNPDGVEVRRVDERGYLLLFADGTRFFVSRDPNIIECSWPADLSFDDALVYLVGPALGAALRLERRSVLHASAVDVDGRALLVMGEAGAGKSTLTAAFVDRGQALITEDVVALTFDGGVPGVSRGGARVKLWDASVIGLRGRADALPALVPSNASWPKKFLDASASMTPRDVTPIGGIFVLDRDDTCTTPRLEELPPHERALVLVANSYAARLVLPDDRAAELERLSTVARAVPVRRLVYPNDMKRLPDVLAFLARACEETA